MERNNKDPNENPWLAEIEVYRTNEENQGIGENARSNPLYAVALEELNAIAESFRQSRPDPDEISKDADAAILTLIHGKSKEIRRQKKTIHLFRRALRPGRAAALAALIIGVISLNLYLQMGRHSAPIPTQRVLPQTAQILIDIDKNGSVDIVDAYLMAQKVKSGHPIPGDWDLNNDGGIDERDIRLVAQTAVALGMEDA